MANNDLRSPILLSFRDLKLNPVSLTFKCKAKFTDFAWRLRLVLRLKMISAGTVLESTKKYQSVTFQFILAKHDREDIFAGSS